MRQRVHVSGVVTGPNGPVSMAMVRLWQPDVTLPAGEASSGPSPIASAVTAGDGSFLFLAAPIGDYLLDAYRPQPPIGEVRMSPEGMPQLQSHDYSSGDPEGWTAAMPIAIAGDTRDIALTMAPRSITGASVSGSVVFDQMMTFNNGRPLDPFHIGLESSTGGGVSGPVRADAPGPFSMSGVAPGQYELRAGSLLQGFQIVAATLGGRDILGTPLDVGPGGVTGLVIRIGNHLNTITGKVTDTQGRAVRDAGIALFPTDRRGWPVVAYTSPRVVYRRAEGDAYAISGFPDGEYFIVAVDDALMANWPSAAVLTSLSAHAVRIDVRGGMAKTQDLVFQGTIK
jgi:protocatechuate 3,4-dioxygenase beta subunit